MKRVFVAGGASFDSVVHVNSFFKPKAQTVFSHGLHEITGGTGAGKALNLARLGFDTRFHYFAGRDRYGAEIRRSLVNSGVHPIRTLDPAGTERHFNIMEDSGDRISIYTAYSTFDPAIPQPLLGQLEREIARADYAVLNIINYVRRLIPLARKHGIPVWCDIHDWDGNNPYHEDFISGADRIFMSSDQMKEGYRAFMERMIDSGKDLVVCTHGKSGSTALTREGKWLEVPALSFEQKDTNGAGDSFFSGFLYAFSRGADTETALRYATVAGGLCVTSPELVHPELSGPYLEEEFRRRYPARN